MFMYKTRYNRNNVLLPNWWIYNRGLINRKRGRGGGGEGGYRRYFTEQGN